MRFLARLLKGQEAVTSVEYSVVLAAILLVVLGAIGLVGARTGGMWSNVATSIETMGE